MWSIRMENKGTHPHDACYFYRHPRKDPDGQLGSVIDKFLQFPAVVFAPGNHAHEYRQQGMSKFSQYIFSSWNRFVKERLSYNFMLDQLVKLHIKNATAGLWYFFL